MLRSNGWSRLTDMNSLHREGHCLTVLNGLLVLQDLNSQAVLAPVQLHELQARYVGRLAIRCSIQKQLQ